MIKACFNVIESLSLPNGLHRASSSDDYGYVWLRDSVYIVLPYVGRSCGTVERVVHRWLDTFRELEDKLTYHTKHRPYEWWQYLHARYSMDGLKEMPGEWGHAQHDSVGAFLWLVGEAHKRGHKVLRDAKDSEIIQKLVDYLVTLEYWHDPDNGMWEEYREVHASSVGACVSGIIKVLDLGIKPPWQAIRNGLGTLRELDGRESETKDIDLAQLSLIYPYDIVQTSIAQEIVRKVEHKLLRARGVVRYVGDSYYSTLEAEHGRGLSRSFYEGSEAEWTMGIPWLALCHLQLGNREKACEYIEWTEAVMITPGVLPELYYAGTNSYNVNTPLGWSSSLYILAKEAYLQPKTI